MDEVDLHLSFWKKSGNKAILNKIAQLIQDILKSPFSGICKPEQLKHTLSGKGAGGFRKKFEPFTKLMSQKTC